MNHIDIIISVRKIIILSLLLFFTRSWTTGNSSNSSGVVLLQGVSFSSPVLVSCEINLVLTLEDKNNSLNGSKLSSCFFVPYLKEEILSERLVHKYLQSHRVLLYKGGKRRVFRCRLSTRSYSFSFLCDKDLVYESSFVAFKSCFHFTLCATTTQVYRLPSTLLILLWYITILQRISTEN